MMNYLGGHQPKFAEIIAQNRLLLPREWIARLSHRDAIQNGRGWWKKSSAATGRNGSHLRRCARADGRGL
ncbi:MAG TPA: hypothetical protein VNN16_03550, partial [Candidatus Sulfotelmatobacter sp.]|nr:hypothetical protein [Candidatus Sulfotelmatobacter sp.]